MTLDNITFSLATNPKNSLLGFCKWNVLPTAGTLSLDSFSDLTAHLIFNQSLNNSNYLSPNTLFSVSIENLPSTEYSFQVDQDSATSFTFTFQFSKSFNIYTLDVRITNSFLLLDIYGRPVYGQINSITMGPYNVQPGMTPEQATVLGTMSSMSKGIAIAVAAGAVPLILTNSLAAVWSLLDALQPLYYYLFINMIMPANFFDFLLLLKLAVLPIPNLANT